MTLLLFGRDPGSLNMMHAVHWILTSGTAGELGKVISDQIRTVSDENSETGKCLVTTEEAGRNTMKVAWPQADYSILPDQPGDIARYLDQMNISLVLTGLDDLDAKNGRYLWQAAREKNIPVYVFADNDIWIQARLKTTEGKDFIPDHIFLMSEDARKDLTGSCIEDHQISVTSNIHLARMRQEGLSQARDLRDAWGCREGETVILYPSLVGVEMAAHGRKVHFDELGTCKRLIGNLASDPACIQPGLPVKNPRLVIRLHPREARDKYDWIDSAGFSFPVVVNSDGSPTDAIFSADIVAGIASGITEEARNLSAEVVELL